MPKSNEIMIAFRRWRMYPPSLKSVRRELGRPSGTESLIPLFPALKRWASLVRPSGAGFSNSCYHWIGLQPSVSGELLRGRWHGFYPHGRDAICFHLVHYKPPPFVLEGIAFLRNFLQARQHESGERFKTFILRKL